jgi:hypothetical protein
MHPALQIHICVHDICMHVCLLKLYNIEVPLNFGNKRVSCTTNKGMYSKLYKMKQLSVTSQVEK